MKKRRTKKFQFDEKKVREMGNLYDDGFSTREVGKEYGVSGQYVIDLFKKYGKERRRTMSPELIAKRFARLKLIPKETLLDLYVKKELAVGDILRELKTTAYFFYKSLKIHNIPCRHKPGNKSESPLTKLLYKMYVEENLTAKEIARRLDCKPRTIQARLSSRGIKKG